MGRTGVIYFIRAGAQGPVKIGYTANDVRGRFNIIQVAHYETLHLLGCMPGDPETEVALHERFSSYRIRGEWFRPCPELLALIAAKAGEQQKPPPAVLEPVDINDIQSWMRLSHQDFAKALRVSVPTLWRWRKKGVPNGPARKLFERLRQEMLAERSSPPPDPWSAL